MGKFIISVSLSFLYWLSSVCEKFFAMRQYLLVVSIAIIDYVFLLCIFGMEFLNNFFCPIIFLTYLSILRT